MAPQEKFLADPSVYDSPIFALVGEDEEEVPELH
jgi:hypothetical protein